MNVLHQYGILPGKPLLPERQWVVEGFEPIRSRMGGVVEIDVNLYDRVALDQPVATVTDLFGEVREIVRASRAGIVWSHTLYPSVATGEMILTLGVEPKLL